MLLVGGEHRYACWDVRCNFPRGLLVGIIDKNTICMFVNEIYNL